MSNVILQEFVSIDALAAGPNDSVDFVPESTRGDQSFGRRQTAFMDSVDTILLGRVTYTMFAGHWPKVTSGDDEPFADKLNAMQKIVFSRSLDRAPWGDWPAATIVRDGAAKKVAELRRRPGKDMVIWGSLSLAQSLMREVLIDEYQLVVCPVILGRGRSLFGEMKGPVGMRLVKTESFDRGAVALTYAPKGA